LVSGSATCDLRSAHPAAATEGVSTRGLRHPVEFRDHTRRVARLLPTAPACLNS